MSEGSQPSADNGMNDDHNSGQVGPWGSWLVLFCLAIAVAVAVNAALRTGSANSTRDAADKATVHAMGLIEPAAKGLASDFTDNQGRLLADPPSDPSKLSDPPILVLAHLVGADAENPGVSWKQLEDQIAAATGRKVEDQPYENSAEQMQSIAEGKIQIVALHAADTPFLVDNYGYQPVAVLGSDNGANGNHLDIIVPAGSTIASPADLRGHSLVCTVPSSITGYRAAIALLMQNQNLRPNVDYTVLWSMGQSRSIEGVTKGEFEAAAVSDDKLKSLLESGQITAASYRVIYSSDVIPRTTIGWFYNLNPDLAAKVRSAILAYTATAAGSDQTLHFMPIDYKKDFQFVRDIDDRFDPRLDARARAKNEPTTQPSNAT
jgi:phosphonate transport system substrate-binding protein